MAKKKTISGSGAEWSNVSNEVEQTLNAWLEQSELTQEELVERINGGSFQITYYREDGEIEIAFEDEKGKIGLPFTWEKRGSVPLAYFKADAGFILLYISMLCQTEAARKKFADFIITHKLNA